MDYEKERQEAISAGRRALDSLNEAQKQLRKARNWGIYDMLGGGLISSVIKHSRIGDARTCIERAKSDLQKFNDELKDVSLNLNVDIGGFLTFFDLMDSFLADVLVQSKLADASRKIDEAIRKVQDILRRLGG